jgi:SAP domain/HMG (high mobility group) box
MSLMKKINKIVDASIQDFCQQIATKFDLNKEELVEMWNTSTSANKKKAPKKKSPYQNYSNYLRPILLAENPEMTFGEISKETSKRWKLFTPAQKQEYALSSQNQDVDAEHDVDAEPKKQVKKQDKKQDKKTSDDSSLDKKKLSELKDLCKAKGLSVNGKKQELIERLTDNNPEDEKALRPVLDMDDNPVSSDAEPDAVSDAEADPEPATESDAEPDAEIGISPISMSSMTSLVEESEDDDDKTQDPSKEVNYATMNITDIKALCKERGVSSKGNKNELIHRLMT